MKMDRLVSADEHKNDSGPIKNWASDASEEHLLVILLGDEVPVGIVHYGGIDSAKDVGWWIASEYRGRGYGNQAIDLLAQFLKRQGVTGIGKITIDTYQGLYNDASCKLVKRLKAYFI